jgi:hypothetical protein
MKQWLQLSLKRVCESVPSGGKGMSNELQLIQSTFTVT